MQEKIILCHVCNGTGKHTQRECTDHHHNDYDIWDEPCSSCDGTGRLVEQITTRKLKKCELELRKK
jgi:DnaJ-class molecular chaperone